MALLKFTFLLLNFLWAAYGFGIGSFKLPNPLKPNVKISSVEVCEPVDTPMAFEAHLDPVRGDDKALSFTMSLPVEITTDTTFTAVADKWADDEWFLNFYSVDGRVCEFFKKWLPKIWPKFVKAVSPNIANDCPYSPGDYSLENFEISKDDMTFPSFIYGLWRLHLRVFDEDEGNFMCFTLALDISM